MVGLTYSLIHIPLFVQNIKHLRALTKLSTVKYSFPNIADISATKNILNIGGYM